MDAGAGSLLGRTSAVRTALVGHVERLRGAASVLDRRQQRAGFLAADLYPVFDPQGLVAVPDLAFLVARTTSLPVPRPRSPSGRLEASARRTPPDA